MRPLGIYKDKYIPFFGDPTGFRVTSPVLFIHILKVEHLASTRMACIDPARAALDPIITDVLSQGAEVSLIKGQLTLKNANHTLVYQQKDWM